MAQKVTTHTSLPILLTSYIIVQLLSQKMVETVVKSVRFVGTITIAEKINYFKQL